MSLLLLLLANLSETVKYSGRWRGGYYVTHWEQGGMGGQGRGLREGQKGTRSTWQNHEMFRMSHDIF